VLSLSKHSLFFSPTVERGREGFDKLSPNGFGVFRAVLFLETNTRSS